MSIVKRLIGKKQFIQLIIIIVLVAVSPYLLGKFNFYGTSHAASTPTPTSQPVSSLSLATPVSYADAVALASPGIVSIKTTKEIPLAINPLFQDPFFRQYFGNQGMGDLDNSAQSGNTPPKEILQGLGSGVIVSDKGYILTNNHVVKGANSLTITLADGRSTEGKVVGTDPDTDLAVLQIKLDKLPVIAMGSSSKLRVGDVVLAIGNPFGLDKTVTQGIVSATERAGTDIGLLENLIQTDAAINPGNSGGALIDSLGRVVGINTAMYSQTGGSQGIGFAIPIDQATEVMNKLIEGKRIIRGYLGIIMQALNKEIRDYIGYKEGEGVYVRAVVRGSPAQKAGLLPGDIIIKINNVVVKDQRMGLQLVAGLTVGKSYPIEIFRKGEYLAFTVIPGEKQPELAVPNQK